MLAVFIRRLQPLQVFRLFMRPLNHTVIRVLRWRHRESLLGETWLVVLAFVILFVLSVRFYHLLDLVCHLGVIASRINHRQSNHRTLLLLTHVEILVLFTEICIVQGRQKLVTTLPMGWPGASHVRLRKWNPSERLLGHVALHVVVAVLPLIDSLIGQPLTLYASVLSVMSLALEVGALIIVYKLPW